MTPYIDEPRTIEELRAWFKERGYEPARTRFFVGVDFRAPKAFGIYQDALGDYIVYKNKADGTRVIRYQGEDEAFAVHELYQRFQEELINQQVRWAADQTKAANSKFSYYEPKNSRPITTVHVLLFFVLAFCSYYFSFRFFQWLRNTQGISLGVFIYMAPFAVMALALLSYRAYLLGQNFRQSISSIPKSIRETFIIFLTILAFISVFANLDDIRDHQDTPINYGTYTSYGGSTYYDDRSSYSTDNHNNHYDNRYDYSWSSNDWDSGYTDWNSDW